MQREKLEQIKADNELQERLAQEEELLHMESEEKLSWDAYEVLDSCRRTSLIASFHIYFNVTLRRCCGRNKWARTLRSRLGNFNGT